PAPANSRLARREPANRPLDRFRQATRAAALFPAAGWKPGDSSIRIAAPRDSGPRKWRRSGSCTAAWRLGGNVLLWLAGVRAAPRWWFLPGIQALPRPLSGSTNAGTQQIGRAHV